MTLIRAAGRRDRDTATLAATGNSGVKDASTRTIAHRTMNRGIDYALRTAAVIVGAVAMINVHEAAHTAVARLAGDPYAWYIFYQSTPSGGFGCLGCNVYDPGRLSLQGNLSVLLSGVVATQIVAFALLAFRRQWRHRPWSGLLTTLTVVFYADLPVQIIQGVAADVAQRQELGSGDLATTMLLLSAGQDELVWLLKLLLLVVGVVLSAFALRVWRGGRAEQHCEVALRQAAV